MVVSSVQALPLRSRRWPRPRATAVSKVEPGIDHAVGLGGVAFDREGGRPGVGQPGFEHLADRLGALLRADVPGEGDQVAPVAVGLEQGHRGVDVAPLQRGLEIGQPGAGGAASDGSTDRSCPVSPLVRARDRAGREPYAHPRSTSNGGRASPGPAAAGQPRGLSVPVRWISATGPAGIGGCTRTRITPLAPALSRVDAGTALRVRPAATRRRLVTGLVDSTTGTGAIRPALRNTSSIGRRTIEVGAGMIQRSRHRRGQSTRRARPSGWPGGAITVKSASNSLVVQRRARGFGHLRSDSS